MSLILVNPDGRIRTNIFEHFGIIQKDLLFCFGATGIF